MNKKILSFILILALLLSFTGSIAVRADTSDDTSDGKPEFIRGEYEYRIMGEFTPRKADAFLRGNSEIYVSVLDAARIAGFKVNTENGQYIFFRSGEPIWSYLNLSMDKDGNCFMNQDAVPFYEEEDGTRWYDLMHLLRYLRAQFIIDDTGENDVAVIDRAEAKDILTLWMEFEPEMQEVQLSQKDLYISHGRAATSVNSALSVAMEGGFDWRLIVPHFGEDAFIVDQYEKALLTLVGEDDFYSVDTLDSCLQILDSYNYGLSASWLSEVASLVSVPGQIMDAADEMDALTYAGKVLSCKIGIDRSVLKVAEGLDKAGSAAGEVLDQAAIIGNFIDIATRSEIWKEDFLRGLSLIRDTDLKLFESRHTVQNIKNAAENLLVEYEDPIRAAWMSTLEKEGGVILRILASKCPGGALLGILDSSTGIADAALSGNEFNTGRATFLVDCLLDLQTVATVNLNREISGALQEIRDYGFVSRERLEKIRSWEIMTLRITQRSYAFVYSLEMKKDSDFLDTQKAEDYLRMMQSTLVLMGDLNKSADYDRNLLNPSDFPLVSSEPLQMRDNLSESIWRTCWFDGVVMDKETNLPLPGAAVRIFRTDEPETAVSVVSADEQGQWKCSLDNRYDYTIEVSAEPQGDRKYTDSVVSVTTQTIEAEKNYFCSSTYMSEISEDVFYEYLRKNVVPEIGVCAGAAFKTPLEEKDMKAGGGTGLLSALTGDLDHDGAPEMVTVTVSEKEISEDMIASLVYKTGSVCVSVDLDLYELENGEVVHADGPRNIGYMERLSHGTAEVDACRWNGFTYFVGKSVMEDLTTYGPHATAVYHPEKGKLVFDFVYGGVWGQGRSRSDDNERMNALKTDFTGSPVDTDHMEVISELEFKLDFVKNGKSNADVTLRDSTMLSEALEKGYDAIRERVEAFFSQLDQDERTAREEYEEKQRQKDDIQNSPAGRTVNSVVEAVQAASGMSLSKTSEEVGDDGSYSVSLKTGGKARFSVKADASGTVTSIRITSETASQTEEWVALKDAVLRLEQLAFPDDVITDFSGKLPLNAASEEYGSYKIDIRNMDNFFFDVKIK